MFESFLMCCCCLSWISICVCFGFSSFLSLFRLVCCFVCSRIHFGSLFAIFLNCFSILLAKFATSTNALRIQRSTLLTPAKWHRTWSISTLFYKWFMVFSARSWMDCCPAMLTVILVNGRKNSFDQKVLWT